MRNIEVTGQVRAFYEAQMRSGESEGLDAVVAPVSDHQNRLGASAVEHDAMRTIESPRFRTQAAESPQVLAGGIIYVDVTRSITVADINITVGRDGQIGGAILLGAAIRIGPVRFRLCRIT